MSNPSPRCWKKGACLPPLVSWLAGGVFPTAGPSGFLGPASACPAGYLLHGSEGLSWPSLPWGTSAGSG
eukprot:3963975-Heterocapsa_arctica.AAC.1